MAETSPESNSVAFIGGGQMAACLIGGLLESGFAAKQVHVAEIDPERRQWLQDTYAVQAHADGNQACTNAATVVLAVKPQLMAQVLRGLRMPQGCVAISIAAAINLPSLQRWGTPGVHWIRVMPNTPSLLCKGISGIYAPAGTPDSARLLAEQLMRSAGEVVWVDSETQLDALTGVSGSGPAYFFYFVEVLRDAGIAQGLSPEMAEELARATLIGAAAMLEQPQADAAQLRRNVTSPGGTTAAAIASMQEQDLAALIARAVQAARERSAALGQQLDREHP